MPDKSPSPSLTNNPPQGTPQPTSKFEIGEEFGTAKKNLPPARIVLIGVAVVIVAWAILAFMQRPSTRWFLSRFRIRVR
jgi:hypothetical protein